MLHRLRATEIAWKRSGEELTNARSKRPCDAVGTSVATCPVPIHNRRGGWPDPNGPFRYLYIAPRVFGLTLGPKGRPDDSFDELG